MTEGNRSIVVASALLALGFVIAGWLLGSEIKDIRLADRYVTVRGLAERTVKADLAIWPLSFKEAGNDLQATYAKSEQDQQAVLQFLAAQGIAKSDISMGQPSVTDTQANEYAPQHAPNRYIVQQSISVRSRDVDKIASAVQKTSGLIAKGVVLGAGQQYGQQNSVRYVFTGLNSIKPEMITEATRNARTAAERFAQDSGSKVGTIRTAEQGLFTISSADAASSGDGGDSSGDGYQADASIMKSVRVVTTVKYYLQQ
ncbi:MAG TPA: SIMPL domain-containing protein [Acidobacteriaceae bacterium]|jgi:hypothetical protein|nr:SIMPL domain-containing protein [Acidobacteriaceae bacterium]